MILPLKDLDPIGPFGKPRPAMRGRYRMSHPLKVLAITSLDGALRLLPVRRNAAPDGVIERILVANWAHLGDVISTIGALRALRHRYPAARIGMIVGSWGQAALAGTGLVDDLHIIDHWALNRSALSRPDKWRQYRTTRRRALQDIRRIRYQAAIDLFPIFPPAHPLFFKVGIPLRIGYVSGGFGPLLTHPVAWETRRRPMADHYRPLLDALSPDAPFLPAEMRPHRDPRTLDTLPANLAEELPYIVVHPGAGSPNRLWGEERWRQFITLFVSRSPGYRIVITGSGAGDVALADQLEQAAPGIINQAGRSDWDTFVRTLASASLVVCPDTVTGHVAAMLDVPVVTIFTGTNDPYLWAPYTDRVAVMTRPVVCAPCNSPGCPAMACFLNVPPADVADAAVAMLTDQSAG